MREREKSYFLDQASPQPQQQQQPQQPQLQSIVDRFSILKSVKISDLGYVAWSESLRKLFYLVYI